MDELPAGLAALVEQARSAHDPTAQDAQRVGQALERALGGLESLAGNSQGSAVSESNVHRSLTGAGVAKWGTGLVIVAAAIGGVIAVQRGEPRPVAALPQLEAAHAPELEPPAAAPVPDSLQPIAAAVAEPPKRTQVPREPRSPQTQPQPRAARTVSTPPPAASDAEELLLIRQAAQALRDQQPALALTLLQSHAERFASGILVQERSGLTVIALCALGRLDEGRALQAQFLASSPNSPLAGRVRVACEAPARSKSAAQK